MKELKLKVEFVGQELEDGSGVVGSGHVTGGGTYDQIDAMAGCLIHTLAETLFNNNREQLPEDGGENAKMECVMRVYRLVQSALDDFMEEQVDPDEFWRIATMMAAKAEIEAAVAAAKEAHHGKVS